MLSGASHIDLKGYLDRWQETGYIDLSLHTESSVELALREESCESTHHSESVIVCRAVDRGYGVSSTSELDEQAIRSAMSSAQKMARAQKGAVSLVPVRTERGSWSKKPKRPFDEESAIYFLFYIRKLLKEQLGPLYARSELVLSHSSISSTLVTSEGTEVSQEVAITDIVVYLIVRGFTTAYVSHIAGGAGGLETIESKDWEAIAKQLARRATALLNATLLPPLQRGSHFRAVLNPEATGALVHEVAHLLEGVSPWAKQLQGLDVAEELSIVDDPTLPDCYGSFMWDVEGVRARRKVVLSRYETNPLHTRLTTSDGNKAGNARGYRTTPSPGMSNVYLSPSDWKVDEMIQDMRSGIYVEGVVRAEADVSDGSFELIPEAAYLVENKELKKPIKRLRLRGNLSTLLKRVDAIGRVVQLRPNLEKGSRISEGGPFIRINGVQCT